MSAFNSGPIAPERNPPINPQYYSPQLAVLSSITPISTFYTQIVTEKDNEFVVGQFVRFVIANFDGMQPLNGLQGIITSITNSTTFYVNIDTTQFGTFNSSGNPTQQSFVIPIGDVNSGAINSSGRINNLLYPEGAFINVSPQ